MTKNFLLIQILKTSIRSDTCSGNICLECPWEWDEMIYSQWFRVFVGRKCKVNIILMKTIAGHSHTCSGACFHQMLKLSPNV